MNIEKLLQYQNIDLKLSKAQAELKKNPIFAKMDTCKSFFSEAQSSIIKNDKQTAEIFRELNYNENRLKELTSGKKVQSYGTVRELSVLENIEADLNKQCELVAAIERDIARLLKRLSEIQAETPKLVSYLSKLKSDYGALSTEAANLNSELVKKHGEIINEKNLLLNEIPEDQLNYYNKRRGQVKGAVLVPYENGFCSGCGIEVKTSVETKLQKAGDVAECPECRRLLYYKAK